MNLPQILIILRDAIPAFNGEDKWQKAEIVEAMLASLPKDDLREVYETVQQWGELPYGLDSHFKWLLKPWPKEPPVRNEPFLDLLKMYKNKKSKRVEYARTQLMRRYEGQSFVHQHAILREFLSGDKKACDWAARQLRDDWREPFAEAIALSWESSPSHDLAITVVRHLPADYVLKHQEALCQYVGYPQICARLLDAPGFTMDEERLGIPDLFYVMARRHRTDSIPYLHKKAIEYVRKFNEAGRSMAELPRIEGFDRILPAMSQLGMTKDIICLYRLRNLVDYLQKQ